MTKVMKIKEINVLTGEITERNATPEELKQMQDLERQLPVQRHVPQVITNRQFRLMLIQMGVGLQVITDEINKLPEPYKQQAWVSWEYAPTFERSNEMVQQLADKLGINADELDTIFIEGERL